MRLLGLPEALQDWGLKVNKIDGWETRGSGNFDPKGLVVHHTGGRRFDSKQQLMVSPSLGICIHGRAPTPTDKGVKGPLCQVMMDRRLVCHVIASGTANHAGTGVWQPGGPGTAALTTNGHVVGIEVENNGIDEPWDDFYDSMIQASAAILQLIGRDSRWCCGHKEWALPKGRKTDPWGLDMPDYRSDVQRALEGGPMAYTLPDDREPVVREIQQILKDTGFYTGDIDGDPGSYDNSQTRHAMHALKNDRARLITELEELRKQLLGQADSNTQAVVKLAGVVRGLKELVAEAEKP